MLDRIRSDIQERLDQLLGEAEKLRRALAALGSRDVAAPATSRSTASRQTKSSRPARSGRPSGRPAGSAARKQRQTPKAKRKSDPRSAKTPRPQARTPSGATKLAVLEALANGEAMTAGEVATATGIGRASVSTTLSRLSKTGEVTKADRGYSRTKSASDPS